MGLSQLQKVSRDRHEFGQHADEQEVPPIVDAGGDDATEPAGQDAVVQQPNDPSATEQIIEEVAPESGEEIAAPTEEAIEPTDAQQIPSSATPPSLDDLLAGMNFTIQQEEGPVETLSDSTPTNSHEASDPPFTEATPAIMDQYQEGDAILPSPESDEIVVLDEQLDGLDTADVSAPDVQDVVEVTPADSPAPPVSGNYSDLLDKVLDLPTDVSPTEVVPEIQHEPEIIANDVDPAADITDSHPVEATEDEVIVLPQAHSSELEQDVLPATIGPPPSEEDLKKILDDMLGSSPMPISETTIIDVPLTPVMDNDSLHSDDKHVSFAPDTPEPKPTKRKKKTQKEKDAKKGKRQSVLATGDSSSRDLADIVAQDEHPSPPTDEPVGEIIQSTEPATEATLINQDDSAAATVNLTPPEKSEALAKTIPSKKTGSSKGRSAAVGAGLFAVGGMFVRPSRSKPSKSTDKEKQKDKDRMKAKDSTPKLPSSDQTVQTDTVVIPVVVPITEQAQDLEEVAGSSSVPDKEPPSMLDQDEPAHSLHTDVASSEPQPLPPPTDALPQGLGILMPGIIDPVPVALTTEPSASEVPAELDVGIDPPILNATPADVEATEEDSSIKAPPELDMTSTDNDNDEIQSTAAVVEADKPANIEKLITDDPLDPTDVEKLIEQSREQPLDSNNQPATNTAETSSASGDLDGLLPSTVIHTDVDMEDKDCLLGSDAPAQEENMTIQQPGIETSAESDPGPPYILPDLTQDDERVHINLDDDHDPNGATARQITRTGITVDDKLVDESHDQAHSPGGELLVAPEACQEHASIDHISSMAAEEVAETSHEVGADEMSDPPPDSCPIVDAVGPIAVPDQSLVMVHQEPELPTDLDTFVIADTSSQHGQESVEPLTVVPDKLEHTITTEVMPEEALEPTQPIDPPQQPQVEFDGDAEHVTPVMLDLPDTQTEGLVDPVDETPNDGQITSMDGVATLQYGNDISAITSQQTEIGQSDPPSDEQLCKATNEVQTESHADPEPEPIEDMLVSGESTQVSDPSPQSVADIGPPAEVVIPDIAEATEQRAQLTSASISQAIEEPPVEQAEPQSQADDDSHALPRTSTSRNNDKSSDSAHDVLSSAQTVDTMSSSRSSRSSHGVKEHHRHRSDNDDLKGNGSGSRRRRRRTEGKDEEGRYQTRVDPDRKERHGSSRTTDGKSIRTGESGHRQRRHSDRSRTKPEQPFQTRTIVPQLLRSFTGSSSSSKANLFVNTDASSHRSQDERKHSPQSSRSYRRERRDSVISKKASPTIADMPEEAIIEEVTPDEPLGKRDIVANGPRSEAESRRRRRHRQPSERKEEKPTSKVATPVEVRKESDRREDKQSATTKLHRSRRRHSDRKDSDRQAQPANGTSSKKGFLGSLFRI